MHVFCTLYEGDYHYGVAALLNSLVQSGFTGKFVIGHRGPQPPWMKQLKTDAAGRSYLGEIEVVCEAINTPWLLAHVKPRFMLDIFDRLVPAAMTVTYADPDIVLHAPWSFFESWMSHGVILCEDCCFPTIAHNHYLRKCWTEFIENSLTEKTQTPVGRYYNSGFVGATREQHGFVELWRRALEALPSAGVPLETFKPGTRFDPFFGTDQDALNMAVMIQPDAISTLGTEGMGFTAGMAVMWHAVDSPKPWRCHYLRQLLITGKRVSTSHREFWRHAAGPVKAWTPWRLRGKRLTLFVTIVLSRFYHSA